MGTTLPALAQTCVTRDEIPDTVRAGIESSALQIFDQASQGQVSTLQGEAIPSLQTNFSNIASAVTDNKAALTGSRSSVRATFLLETGATPVPEGRYVCGVFGANGLAANSAEFDIPNIPAGKYGIVVQDLTGGSKGPYALTVILQEMNGWKLAGLYIRPETANMHDGIWYLQRAREFKAKGQNHNAWFYYVTSWELLAPVRFMDSNLLSKIIRESSAIQPRDVPVAGNSVSFTAGGKTYNFTEITVFSTDTTLDLSIRYSVPSAADFLATQAEARSLATAYAAQFPELKDAFNSVMVHAIDPSGQDVVGLVSLKK